MCCFSTSMRDKHVLFSDNHVCLYMPFMCDKRDSYVLKLSIHVLTHTWTHMCHFLTTRMYLFCTCMCNNKDTHV